MAVLCGNCNERHATAQDVRECYLDDWDQVAQQEAELAAELRNERWFEERGGGPSEIDEDNRRGLLSFQDAWSLADPTHVQP